MSYIQRGSVPSRSSVASAAAEAPAAPRGGISTLLAAVFITGTVAGSGMLALANSVRLTGACRARHPRNGSGRRGGVRGKERGYRGGGQMRWDEIQ